MAESAAKRNALVAPDQLAGLGENQGPVRLDVLIAGDAPQQAVELARLIDQPLQAWPESLGHPQRFIRAGSKHGQERRNHQRQQQHERRDRRHRPVATEPAEHPLIDRVAQAGKDGRQEDGHQERADHRDEGGGDRGDQQEEKGLAEARLCHRAPITTGLRYSGRPMTAGIGSRGRSTVKTHPVPGRSRE